MISESWYPILIYFRDNQIWQKIFCKRLKRKNRPIVKDENNDYYKIFKEDIDKEIVEKISKIIEVREKMMNEEKKKKYKVMIKTKQQDDASTFQPLGIKLSSQLKYP